MTGLFVAVGFAGRSRRFAAGITVTAAEVEADGHDTAQLTKAGYLTTPPAELADKTETPDADPPPADPAQKSRKTRS